MKIVHLFFSFTAGGAEILAVDLMNEMCLNNNVSLIIVNKKWNGALLKTINPKIAVYYLNRKEGSKNPIPILRLNFLLFKLNPDVVHCHNHNMAALVKLTRLKLIYTVHDMGIATTYFNKYSSLVAISDSVKNEVISKGHYKVKTIVNGINNKLFIQRNNYSINESEPFRLVQVSRLIHDKKGQDILITALKGIRDNYNFDNFVLDIVGGGSSLNFLEKLVATLGLESKVRFLGEKNREWIYRNLCSYHLLVQPSRFEGFGLTVVEGLAAGLPVLASNIEGPLEILSQTPAGFLFINEDINDCAKAIYTLFEMYSNNQIAPLMKEVQKFVENKYSITTCAENYLKEYADN